MAAQLPCSGCDDVAHRIPDRIAHRSMLALVKLRFRHVCTFASSCAVDVGETTGAFKKREKERNP